MQQLQSSGQQAETGACGRRQGTAVGMQGHFAAVRRPRSPYEHVNGVHYSTEAACCGLQLQL